ncbi:MAG: hypothetical protein J6D87_00360 [Clostridia bacterium]|nr:hypothetical protein [Clostridia bacterium]MBQ7315534.1 hypothetical protein [Clostridia bacterium]
MDLRMVKTRQQIKTAFLKLRERLMPDKIKVKDICEMAMINKTTFYHHYADSWELSNEIDDNAIERVLSDFDGRDKIFDDPKTYIVGLLQALEREAEYLRLVFRGKQEVLCGKLEKRLHDDYDSRVKSDDDRIRLSFAIGGFISVVKDYILNDAKNDIAKLTENTAYMLELLLKKERPLLEGATQ